MLVCGILAPHPPIILPEIGGKETKKVHQTTSALAIAAKKLATQNPAKIIIISPHEAHGFEVPWYFLGKHLPEDIAIEKILVTESSYQYYYEFGRSYSQKINKDKKRIAIIASGDLSHVLKSYGSYGFNSAGPKLDALILKGIKNKDVQSLLKIDREILGNGAECGLRSIIFLMSVLEDIDYEVKVLSYEGPFGVGYAVATFLPEDKK